MTFCSWNVIQSYLQISSKQDHTTSERNTKIIGEVCTSIRWKKYWIDFARYWLKFKHFFSKNRSIYKENITNRRKLELTKSTTSHLLLFLTVFYKNVKVFGQAEVVSLHWKRVRDGGHDVREWGTWERRTRRGTKRWITLGTFLAHWELFQV